MPTAKVALTVNYAGHQVNIYVKDPAGKALQGVKASVYRAFNPLEPIMPSLVTVSYTDSEGYVFFDGLWPWIYAVEVIHEGRHLYGKPIMFDVNLLKPGETFIFNLKVKPPPITYLFRVQLGWGLSDIAAWLVSNLPSLTYAVDNAGGVFEKAWAEEGWLNIRFRIEESPGWILPILAILAILILLGFISWNVTEAIKAIPPEARKILMGALLLGGVAAVGVAGAYAFSKLKGKR